MAEHTPIPWRISSVGYATNSGSYGEIESAEDTHGTYSRKSSGEVILVRGSGQRICTFSTNGCGMANAALIVRAVNSHAALVEALRAMERWMSEAHSETDGDAKSDLRDTWRSEWRLIDQARAALALAQEGT